MIREVLLLFALILTYVPSLVIIKPYLNIKSKQCLQKKTKKKTTFTAFNCTWCLQRQSAH